MTGKLPITPSLQHRLTTVEYFTFGFGSMVGVGWLVLMDDWLGRGGPAGTMIGFLLGGLLLLPVARTYGSLVRRIPDAGAEIAYTEGVFPPMVSFATGWTMVLAYAIVCPWEAVAIGNLLARIAPSLNSLPLYTLAGKAIYAPRVVAGLLLTATVLLVNLRGIRTSGVFQDVTTFGLLAAFAVFAALGFARGEAANMAPLFARPGTAGALLSILLAVQIVPYFMTGFESVVKGSEEARAGFDPLDFGRAMYLAVVAGCLFYVLVVGVVSFVHPWQEIVAGKVGTEVAFERAFGSRGIARLILAAAFLSLLKVFNGNFVAATRLVLAIGRRGLLHPALARVHPAHGAPAAAIWLIAGLTAVASLLGDALLVPITEVGSMAAGIGWLSACVAWLLRVHDEPRWPAWLGAAVSVGFIAMKALPFVPGSFTIVEWLALAGWLALGFAFWSRRARPAGNGPVST
jgi:basic amino acid/polyamine antiporter, APA family